MMKSCFNLLIITTSQILLKVYGTESKSLNSQHLWHQLDEEKDERSLESEGCGDGDDSGGNNHELVSSLGVVEILAIVIGGIIVSGIVVFLGACAWQKMRRNPNNDTAHVIYTDDESALNMVDYDELSIQNARLSVDLPQNTTTESDT